MIRIGRTEPVTDASHVAAIRRAAQQCAEVARLDETSAGRVALVATELATNILKHGGGGSILFGSSNGHPQSVTLVAIDRGRGMVNVQAAMQDGYSTAGSNGTGLGAVVRSAAHLDVYSLPEKGTVILCRVDGAPPPPVLGTPMRMVIGGICLPKKGEEQSGDSWVATVARDGATITVADGLGHGDMAATASMAAIRIAADRAELTLEALLQEMHGALRPTRGAAVGIARIFAGSNRLDFAGAGNIAGTIIGEEATRRVVSLNGIVGHEMRKVQVFSYPWAASSVLVLQSDGVSANWNQNHYPGLTQHDPALIAAVLYRDHCRGSDDATVVVAKAT